MSLNKVKVDWVAEGKSALLDLLSERLIIPWFEAESRISSSGWKSFRQVQPLQLHESRTSLVHSGDIIEERTKHTFSVVTVRLPFPPNRIKELSRLRGARRKHYRTCLKWTNDETLCGKHAERIVLDSLNHSAPQAGLYVPPQSIGKIKEVNGVQVLPGPLDNLAYILELPSFTSALPLVVEVKNINRWIYPWTKELWELLVKAADLATHFPIVPLLVCMRYAYPTRSMAMDIGFFCAPFVNQLFNPSIPESDFQDIFDEFGLTIIQHNGPLDSINAFLTKTLRLSPPLSPPYDEDIQWYKRQAQRFTTIAPVILAYRNLANNLKEDARSRMFSAFTTAAHAARQRQWPAVRGW